MKIIRNENNYTNQYGEEVTWQHISSITGLDRSESRLLLKKLAEHGEPVPEEQLMEWRQRERQIFRLEALIRPNI